MGYDLVSYLDIDQHEISEFINNNKIDINNEDECEKISKYYKEKYISQEKLRIVYEYNENVSMHEIWSLFSSSFIKDDERFTNRRYRELLEKKNNKTFPLCLEDINWKLRTKENALEIAKGLEDFFPDDIKLQKFAKWLRITAKYCSTYELSY
jgi:hypothetical protein